MDLSSKLASHWVDSRLRRMKVWWIVSGLARRAGDHIERGVVELGVPVECSLARACGGRPG